MDKYLYNKIRVLDKREGDWHMKLPDLACFVDRVRQNFSVTEHTESDIYFYTELEIKQLMEYHTEPSNWPGMKELYQSLEPAELLKKGIHIEDLELSLKVFGLNFEDTWLAAYWLKNFLRLNAVSAKDDQPDVHAELKKMAEVLSADNAELTVKNGNKTVFSSRNKSVLSALNTVLSRAARSRKPFEIDLDDQVERIDMASLRLYFAEIFQSYVNKNGYSLSERKKIREELLTQWRNKHRVGDTDEPNISCAVMNIVAKMMVLTRMITSTKLHTAAEYFNDYKLLKSTIKPNADYLKKNLRLLFDRTQADMLKDTLRDLYPDEEVLDEMVRVLLETQGQK